MSHSHPHHLWAEEDITCNILLHNLTAGHAEAHGSKKQRALRTIATAAAAIAAAAAVGAIRVIHAWLQLWRLARCRIDACGIARRYRVVPAVIATCVHWGFGRERSAVMALMAQRLIATSHASCGVRLTCMLGACLCSAPRTSGGPSADAQTPPCDLRAAP